MNGRERILASLAGEKVDRRPVAPLLSLYGARLTGCPLSDYFTDARCYAEGQAAVNKTFLPDLLYAPFAFSRLGEAFGSQIYVPDNQSANIRRPAIQSAIELNKLISPDPLTRPRIQFFIDAVRRMVDAHGGEVMIGAPTPSPADFPPLFMGLDAWMNTLLFDPDGARQVLEYASRFVVEFSNLIIDAGADFVMFPAAFFTPVMLTRTFVVDLIRPATVTALEQMKRPIVMHHGGTPLGDHIDLMIGLPNMAALVVDEHDSLTKARTLFGPKFPLIGGLMGPTLPDYTEASVKSKYLQLLDERQADPRFILCTCGPDIPLITPPENIHAIRSAAETFSEQHEPL